MRRMPEAADDTKWLAAEIQRSVDDPLDDISHVDVMAEMDAQIEALLTTGKRNDA